MLRQFVGFALLALIAILALKLVFGLLGFAFQLLWAVLWLAVLGFGIYLVLKVISPETARRVKDKIRGGPRAA